MTTAQHTPGPWGTAKNVCGEPLIVRRGKQITVIANVHLTGLLSADDGFANARFIVTACNAHKEMLEALEVASAQLQDLHDSIYDAGKQKVRTAIAKAKGMAA